MNVNLLNARICISSEGLSALITFIAFERPKGLAIELRLPDPTHICLDEETEGIKWKLLSVPPPHPPKNTLKKKEAHYSTASNSDLFWGLWKRLVMGLIGQRHLVIEKWNQWLLGSMRPPLCSVLPACSWLLQASRTSGAAETWARKGWDNIEVHTPSSYYASVPHWHQRCKGKWSHLNPITVINPPSHTFYQKLSP